MTTYKAGLSKATLADVTVGKDGAEETSRCLPDNDDRSEWREDGMIDGVPVSIYYMTTPEDADQVGEDGDWSMIDWANRIDRIEIDLNQCDRMETTDAVIEALIARLGAPGWAERRA